MTHRVRVEWRRNIFPVDFLIFTISKAVKVWPTQDTSLQWSTKTPSWILSDWQEFIGLCFDISMIGITNHFKELNKPKGHFKFCIWNLSTSLTRKWNVILLKIPVVNKPQSLIHSEGTRYPKIDVIWAVAS